MKHDIAIGRIETIERLRNSTNGNPRFAITLEISGLGTFTKTWNTAADHAFCYAIGNRGYGIGDVVVAVIGGRGTITALKPHDDRRSATR